MNEDDDHLSGVLNEETKAISIEKKWARGFAQAFPGMSFEAFQQPFPVDFITDFIYE
jgi:hypothetical protein